MGAIWQFVENFGLIVTIGVIVGLVATEAAIVVARLAKRRETADKIARAAYAATWMLRFSGDGRSR